MSKEHLQNVVNHIISGDVESAKKAFSAHTQEKAKEIFNPKVDDDNNTDEE